MKTIKHGELRLGDIVLYNESIRSWVPAIIESIHPQKDGKPVLALVVFVTGMHGSSFPVDRSEHGKALNEWLTRDEAEELFKDPEKARLEAERKHLDKLHELEEKALADLDKLTPEKRKQATLDPANVDPEGIAPAAAEPEPEPAPERVRPGRTATKL